MKVEVINMSLDQLVKKAEEFVKVSAKSTQEYLSTAEDYKQKVSEGRMGSVEAREKLDDIKSTTNALLSQQGATLNEEVRLALEAEYQRVDNESETVTADQLAELTLLGELELTNEDMEKYADKYKNNPLALKKLKDIAKEKTLFVEFPRDRKEFIHAALGRMESTISKYSRPEYDAPYIAQKIEFLSEGAIQSFKEDITYYKSL